jgi:hypothetical protein
MSAWSSKDFYKVRYMAIAKMKHMDRNMKNWLVQAGRAYNKSVMVLTHKCRPEAWREEDFTDDKPHHWCSKDPDGWYCGLCGARPPQAMVDAADFTQCHPLHIYNIDGYIEWERELWWTARK